MRALACLLIASFGVAVGVALTVLKDSYLPSDQFAGSRIQGLWLVVAVWVVAWIATAFSRGEAPGRD